MSLRYDEIADILKAIEASACEELIIETGDVRLVVRRRGAGPPLSGSAPDSVEWGARAPARDTLEPNLPAAPSPTRANATVVAAPESGGFAVRAPMVGTFYRASSPGAAPFVEVGSGVRAGDPLCLIEVMKLFTTIHAEQAGRILQIGATDGEFVEYGRVLFVMEPIA